MYTFVKNFLILILVIAVFLYTSNEDYKEEVKQSAEKHNVK